MANSRTSPPDLFFTKPVVIMIAVAVAALIAAAAGSVIKPAGAAEADAGFDSGYERIAEESVESRDRKKKKKKKKKTRRGSFY